MLEYHQRTGAAAFIYRFPNVFGKWSRPNYNTVVATFCHNISRGLPVQINNPEAVVRFIYIDDVIRAFLGIADRSEHDARVTRPEIGPILEITIGGLRDEITSFRENRRKGLLPDLSDPLVKYLYSTYLSFLETGDFAYPVELEDGRSRLAVRVDQVAPRGAGLRVAHAAWNHPRQPLPRHQG